MTDIRHHGKDERQAITACGCVAVRALLLRDLLLLSCP